MYKIKFKDGIVFVAKFVIQVSVSDNAALTLLISHLEKVQTAGGSIVLYIYEVELLLFPFQP